jgi:hypothetical protein
VKELISDPARQEAIPERRQQFASSRAEQSACSRHRRTTLRDKKQQPLASAPRGKIDGEMSAQIFEQNRTLSFLIPPDQTVNQNLAKMKN